MKILIAIAALLVSGAAAASEPTTGSADERKPGKMVCKSKDNIGSRLGSQRVCMTVAEWDAHRLQTRAEVDQAQTRQINITSDQYYDKNARGPR
jgi:hypothetical protein